MRQTYAEYREAKRTATRAKLSLWFVLAVIVPFTLLCAAAGAN